MKIKVLFDVDNQLIVDSWNNIHEDMTVTKLSELSEDEIAEAITNSESIMEGILGSDYSGEFAFEFGS